MLWLLFIPIATAMQRNLKPHNPDTLSEYNHRTDPDWALKPGAETHEK